MSNPAPQLVQKLWNYCSILRDDGLSFHFRRGYGGTSKPSAVPKEFAWLSLPARDGN